jgi:Domain of unknown function (DUF4136)
VKRHRRLKCALRALAVLAIPLSFALGGCSQFAVRAEHDQSADFGRLRTYAWLPLSEAAPADQRVLDRYIDARIRSAVDTALGAKGYRPAGSDPPDFFLNYRVVSDTAEQEGIASRSYLLGARWEGWSGVEGVYRDTYRAGTLYVAVIDARTRKMIWLGAASARLLPTVPLEKRAQRVDAAVHQIFERFPPT